MLCELANTEDEILARRMEREQRWREEQARKQAEEDISLGNKRKHSTSEEQDEQEAPLDLVKLGQTGYHERYYEHKFGITDVASPESIEKISSICHSYLEGLAWVLDYYYQGVQSWKWFYPYHYGPFAKDLSDYLKSSRFSSPKFELGKPFRPFDQLMSVFPAESSGHLPEPFRLLMKDSNSPIFKFYPEEFKIDLNGKRYAWQGVALLPFIDEKLLLETLEPIYKDQLNHEAKELNRQGQDEIWIGNSSSLFGFIGCLEDNHNCSHTEAFEWQVIDAILSDGINGQISFKSLDESVASTIDSFESIALTDVLCAYFKAPIHDGYFEARVLPGFIPPTPILTDSDRAAVAAGRRRPFFNNSNRSSAANTNTMLREHYDRETSREIRGFKDENPNYRGSSPSASSPHTASSMFYQPSPHGGNRLDRDGHVPHDKFYRDQGQYEYRNDSYTSYRSREDNRYENRTDNYTDRPSPHYTDRKRYRGQGGHHRK